MVEFASRHLDQFVRPICGASEDAVIAAVHDQIGPG